MFALAVYYISVSTLKKEKRAYERYLASQIVVNL